MKPTSRFNRNYSTKSSISANKNPQNNIQLSGSQISLAHRDDSPRRVKAPTSTVRSNSACQRPRPRPSWRRPSSADNNITLPPSFAGSTVSLCESIAEHRGYCQKSRTVSSHSLDDKTERKYSMRKGQCSRPVRVDFTECDDGPGSLHPLRHVYTAASSHLLQTLLREPWRSDGSDESSSPRSDRSLGSRIKELAENSRNKQFEKSDAVPPKDSGRTESTLCLKDLESSLARNSERLVNQENSIGLDIREASDATPNKCGSSTMLTEREAYAIAGVTEVRCRQTSIHQSSRDAEIDMKFERWFASTDKLDHEKNVRYVDEKFSESSRVQPDKASDKCPSPILIDLSKDEREEKSKKDEMNFLTDVVSARGREDVPLPHPTPRDSTYEDLVNILQVLETDQPREHVSPPTPRNAPSAHHTPRYDNTESKPITQASEIMQFLDQVEMLTEPMRPASRAKVHSALNQPQCLIASSANIPRIEELLCRNTVDLAQEVLSLRLQAEEQAGGIRLLQQTVAELKEAAKAAKAAYQAELDKAANEAESALLRHQKMVKQLLAEKKSLNEKMSALINETKSNEERHQRNLKAMEERHLVEIQRVKETQAAAEKLKREKWIDVKTQKIKEMTVKGLEPELSRMAARQQQELTELRSLHRAELEAVELRAARRSTELLDQLRAELTRDKEEAIQREAAAQRARFEKMLEEEQRRLEDECRRLKDDLRREKERMAALEAHVQDSLAEARRNGERERERERLALVREHEERMEDLQRLHQNEVRSLKEALEIEKEVWMNNYKKLQANKMLEREAELHHQYKKDRDRDIEIAIDRLESEATKARLELTEIYESRLTRLREKLETEVKEAEEEVQNLKTKLSDARLQLAAKDDEVSELSTRLRHQQTEFSQMKTLCEEMSQERAELRKVLRLEMEDELAKAAAATEAIRNEMAELRTNHMQEILRREQLIEIAKVDAERELQHVYNRVKVTISKKDEALESLREQYKVALERCSHLEQMLDNQRRNLLLK